MGTSMCRQNQAFHPGFVQVVPEKWFGNSGSIIVSIQYLNSVINERSSQIEIYPVH